MNQWALRVVSKRDGRNYYAQVSMLTGEVFLVKHLGLATILSDKARKDIGDSIKDKADMKNEGHSEWKMVDASIMYPERTGLRVTG